MHGGRKAASRWRIGTEHEKLVYRTADHRALPMTRQAASATC
jgi:glutamate--cysteine ligase